MNRGIPFDALAERLAQARDTLRRNREGDITAPHHHVELQALVTFAGEWLSQARACGEQSSARRAEEAEEQARAASEQARSIRAEAPTRSDLRTIPREEPPEVEGRRYIPPDNLKKARRRINEATVPLNFSAAQSYCFDDPTRKIRFTVTVENLLPE